MYIDKKTSTALLHPRVTYFIPVLGDLKRFPAVTLKLYTYTSTLVEPCHLNKSSCSFQLIASTLSRSIIKSAPKLRRLAASTTARSLVQALDIFLPLLSIRAEDSSIIRIEAIHLAFDIGCLCPDSAIAFVSLNLFPELTEEDRRTVIVGIVILTNLVRLRNCINRLLHVPKAMIRSDKG